MRKVRLASFVAAMVAAGAAFVSITGSAGADNLATIGNGPTYVYGSPNPFADATVTVQAAELGADNLQVVLSVEGIDAAAGTTFGAHVHTAPCGTLATAAGGHYQHLDSPGQLARKEIWLDLTVNANGQAQTVATRQFRIAGSTARSVIIHAIETDRVTGVAGARLVCTNVNF